MFVKSPKSTESDGTSIVLYSIEFCLAETGVLYPPPVITLVPDPVVLSPMY